MEPKREKGVVFSSFILRLNLYISLISCSENASEIVVSMVKNLVLKECTCLLWFQNIF